MGDSPAAMPPAGRWARNVWAPVFAAAAFVMAVLLANHVLGQYRWADVLARIGTIPRSHLLAAVSLTIGSYFVLTFYDVIALRYAQARLGWPKTAIASFSAYAVGHNVGVATLSGGSIRYRVYSSAGLSAK